MKSHPILWLAFSVLALLITTWFFFGDGGQEQSPSSDPIYFSTGSEEQSSRPREKQSLATGKLEAEASFRKAVESEAGDMLKLEIQEPEALIRLLEQKKERAEREVEQSDQGTFEALLTMVEEAERLGDYDAALDLLLNLKDVSSGEDLQSVLKKLADYGESGGNEAIIDAFLSSESLLEIERFRMLSYVNPDYPLGQQSVAQLQNTYVQVDSRELRDTISHTLAVAGGEDG